MNDQERGLYAKYTVGRLSDPEGKHAECRYFVLDPQHDPIAREALVTYAIRALLDGRKSLYRDLMDWISFLKEGES